MWGGLPFQLFMAPFGAYILHRINVEWMPRGVVLLNIGQLLYFNFSNLSCVVASLAFLRY